MVTEKFLALQICIKAIVESLRVKFKSNVTNCTCTSPLIASSSYLPIFYFHKLRKYFCVRLQRKEKPTCMASNSLSFSQKWLVHRASNKSDNKKRKRKLKERSHVRNYCCLGTTLNRYWVELLRYSIGVFQFIPRYIMPSLSLITCTRVIPHKLVCE